MADDSFMHFLDGYLEGRLRGEELKQFYSMLEDSEERRDLLATNTVISRLIELSTRKPVSTEQIINSLPRHGDTARLIIDQIRSSLPAPEKNSGRVLQTRKSAPNGKNNGTGKNRIRFPQADETSGVLVFLRFLAAAAACAAIAFGVWRHNNPQFRQSPAADMQALARLEARGGVTITRGTQTLTATDNDRIFNGDVVSAGNYVTAIIRYNSENTIIKLHGGTSLKVQDHDGAKNLMLNSGGIIASVSPQPKELPMTVTTPRTVITVLGTEFSLKDKNAQSILEVTSGKVRLTRSADNSSVDVQAGNRVEVSGTSTLSVQSIPGTVWGHLSDVQVADMFNTMSTVKAMGINALSYNVTSISSQDLPQNLRTAIAAAHNGEVQFHARIDIPKDIRDKYDTFMNNMKIILPHLVRYYDFDGLYITRPIEFVDNNLFKRIMNDIHACTSDSGISMTPGIQHETTTNDTWFIGY